MHGPDAASVLQAKSRKEGVGTREASIGPELDAMPGMVPGQVECPLGIVSKCDFWPNSG